jgi:hypothetical protein
MWAGVVSERRGRFGSSGPTLPDTSISARKNGPVARTISADGSWPP